MTLTDPKDEGNSVFQGFIGGLLAFVGWGLLPVYWKQLQAVPATEILCHRVVWSLLFVALVLTAGRSWRGPRQLLGDRRKLALLMLSGFILGANWLIYIFAVNSGRVLDASLGYFITPLVNVLFGFLFFHDRLGRLQTLALALAVAGVGYQLVLIGRLPLIALGLALTFGTYGLIRKWVHVDALTGLFMETLVLLLPALAFLFYRAYTGAGAFAAGDRGQDLLLVGTGIATSLPLLAFAFGARRLSLVSVGFLQYISPTLAFLLGFFVYHEPLEGAKFVTFILIWIAIALYSVESLMRWKRRERTGVPHKRG